MCGIAGVASFSGTGPAAELVSEMNDLLAHRGPDGGHLWRHDAGQVVFGHRRLAVLDLSSCADQPMHNTECVAAGRATPLTMVFNGEIYNYRELREGLIQRGHRLVSQSDSEVILHLYEEKGPRCLDELRGMFALAIWDDARGSLFCARDRVGKKPLYYRHDGSSFWFASEPRAVLADPRVPLEVDRAAIRSYLALGYVPGPSSALRGLKRLQPGHYLTATVAGVEEHRYWRLDYLPKRQITEADAIAELRGHLEEAVRLRLVSDVPLGAFLSGGVDSSAVVAYMSRLQASVKTFSIGFDDAEYNELPYAREVAARFGTDHHEFVVTPDIADLLPALAWHYGEPYADSSALPTYFLARLARQHITVALNGDGGDESFAGYTRYVANRGAEAYQKLPRALRRALEASIAALPATSSFKSPFNRVRRFFRGASLPPHLRYAAWFDYFQSTPGIISPELETAAPGGAAIARMAEEFAARAALGPIDRPMAVDVALYLPDDLLVKVDIATMAHGLESRSPLLDHVLMEFAATLPESMKANGRQKKYLLKKALRGIVPDTVMDRPKMGFGVPLDAWFRGQLRDPARDILFSQSARSRGYFDQRAVERMFDEHLAGRESHGHRLWALLMLEVWHQVYIDAARGSRPRGAGDSARLALLQGKLETATHG